MIKVGITHNLPDVVNLVRLLGKHPDVEIVWMHNFDHTFDITNSYPELTGDISLRYTDRPDFNAIDLYIGAPYREDHKKLAFANPALKAIFCAPYDHCADAAGCPVEIGLPEFNRKALVRGARAAYLPDEITYLGALALMPLAKNLLLGSPISASVLLPTDTDARGGEARGMFMSDSLTRELREKVLLPLQTSFNAPLNILPFSTPSHVCIGTFVIDTRMNLCDILQIYHKFYDDHRHVVILPDTAPGVYSRLVEGTNKSVIGLRLADNRLFISTAFDSRFKLGAGNIIHLLNLLFGLDERTGL